MGFHWFSSTFLFSHFSLRPELVEELLQCYGWRVETSVRAICRCELVGWVASLLLHHSAWRHKCISHCVTINEQKNKFWPNNDRNLEQLNFTSRDSQTKLPWWQNLTTLLQVSCCWSMFKVRFSPFVAVVSCLALSNCDDIAVVVIDIDVIQRNKAWKSAQKSGANKKLGICGNYQFWSLRQHTG